MDGIASILWDVCERQDGLWFRPWATLPVYRVFQGREIARHPSGVLI